MGGWRTAAGARDGYGAGSGDRRGCGTPLTAFPSCGARWNRSDPAARKRRAVGLPELELSRPGPRRLPEFVTHESSRRGSGVTGDANESDSERGTGSSTAVPSAPVEIQWKSVAKTTRRSYERRIKTSVR
jgi:hypothetical protein